MMGYRPNCNLTSRVIVNRRSEEGYILQIAPYCVYLPDHYLYQEVLLSRKIVGWFVRSFVGTLRSL